MKPLKRGGFASPQVLHKAPIEKRALQNPTERVLVKPPNRRGFVQTYINTFQSFHTDVGVLHKTPKEGTLQSL